MQAPRGAALTRCWDTRAGEVQWREHGFGPWAIRDLCGEGFLGSAELRFAGDRIEGIKPDEVEAGWWGAEERGTKGSRHRRWASRSATSGVGQTPTASRPTSARARTRSLRVAAKLGF